MDKEHWVSKINVKQYKHYKEQAEIISENHKTMKKLNEETNGLIREGMKHLLSDLGLSGIVSIYDSWSDKTYVGKILINSKREFEFHKLTKKGEPSCNPTYISDLTHASHWYYSDKNFTNAVETLSEIAKPFEPQKKKDTPEIER